MPETPPPPALTPARRTLYRALYTPGAYPLRCALNSDLEPCYWWRDRGRGWQHPEPAEALRAAGHLRLVRAPEQEQRPGRTIHAVELTPGGEDVAARLLHAYAYIRRAYGLDFRAGQRVRLLEDAGRLGTVQRPHGSFLHYVRVLPDGAARSGLYHPRSIELLNVKEPRS